MRGKPIPQFLLLFALMVFAANASAEPEVPELGEVLQVINTMNLTASAPGQEPLAGTITKEVAKELGQTLKIQGIILGNVEEYSIVRSSSGSYPEVSLSLRMIDAKTGSIIWAISHTEKGNRIIPSVLGIGEGTVTETAIKACKNIVKHSSINDGKGKRCRGHILFFSV